MYMDAGLTLPYSQGFPDDELLFRFHTVLPCHCPHLGNLLQTPTVSDYDLGGEGDLFKAPEPIIGEPELSLDPVTAAISLIQGGGDVITAETIKVADMESIQNERLDDVLFECKRELLAKSAIEEENFAASLDLKVPVMLTEVEKIRIVAEGPIQKSVSAGCLSSMEWISGCSMRPNFLDFQGLDFGAAFGMRRAYSEGDIQTLGNYNSSNGSTTILLSSLEEQVNVSSDLKSEERREKLSRYRRKKSKRNFGRKIKYACRKALAESQPRVRGRFAKTEDSEVPRPLK